MFRSCDKRAILPWSPLQRRCSWALDPKAFPMPLLLKVTFRAGRDLKWLLHSKSKVGIPTPPYDRTCFLVPVREARGPRRQLGQEQGRGWAKDISVLSLPNSGKMLFIRPTQAILVDRDMVDTTAAGSAIATGAAAGIANASWVYGTAVAAANAAGLSGAAATSSALATLGGGAVAAGGGGMAAGVVAVATAAAWPAAAVAVAGYGTYRLYKWLR